MTGTGELKILILEDDENDADLMQRELKGSNLRFAVEVVQTRESFEHALRNFKPDIILSDYSLPSFDGIAAFHIKENLSPDIPFIIVSGIIGEEKAVELIKDGVTDYVLKDNLVSLTFKIKRALKESEQRKTKKLTDARLKTQYKELFEIALLQSHQVRVPMTQIIGLFKLFKFDNLIDPINGEILSRLNVVALSMDNIVHNIVKKTYEIKSAITTSYPDIITKEEIELL
jgi:DNA-binding response OmpR family regulator